MGNERIFRVGRVTDKQIQTLFEKISTEFPSATGTAFFGDHIQFEIDSFLEQELPQRSFSIHRASVSAKAPSFTIEFRRGISTNDFNTRQPSFNFDEFQLRINQGPSNQRASLEQYLQLAQLVDGISPEITDFSGDDTSNTSILHAELNKLSELAAELITGADEKRREIDSYREKLDSDASEAKLRQETHFEAIRSDLEQKRQALEQLRAELDDREHKHVRRELRETITSEIQASIAKPTSGLNSGLRYNLLALYFAIFSAAGLGYFAFQTQMSISEIAIERVVSEDGRISSKPAEGIQVYLLYIKLFFSSAASLGLLVYIINWFRSLARDEVTYKRSLEQYVFDINRASWTIETILELSDSELTEIPATWLDRVTNGMFVDGNSDSDEASSLQALAALLNVTTEAEIGPDGPKFRLNKRAAKKAASEAK